jgi:hypothetical protein
MEEIRAKILAANKAYISLKPIFQSKQVHRNKKIRLYRVSHSLPNAAFP